MKFGEFPLSDILGATLAHSVRFTGGALKKGHILTKSDIRTLAEHDISHAMVAILEADDISEDRAAGEIAARICGNHIRCAQAFTGRANLHAMQDGLVTINAAAVNGLNHHHEAVTLATISRNAMVSKGQMIATVKIIPLGIEKSVVDKIVSKIPDEMIRLDIFQAQEAVMIQTCLSVDSQKLFEKSSRVMTHRLAHFAISLVRETRCAHKEEILADQLSHMAEGDHSIILIMGASAITDRRDVIPAAIESAGGQIIHFGMPVDPGNLMLLANYKGKWVLGLPGCSRSPKLNGIDLILSRIAAGRGVTAADVMNMGVGGLLSEYPGRPQPREGRQKKKPQGKNIAALILAAGQSTRMGKDNKLLLDYKGESVLSHVLAQVKKAGIKQIFAVTGHQQDKVSAEISRHDVTIFHNDLYAEGMSTSVRHGIKSLPPEVDAVLIILGDMPGITAEILRMIIAAYNPDGGHGIVIPKHLGKRGNPLLWDREFFSDFDRLDGDMGAKSLLGDYPEFITEVEVNSDAIFMDIDSLQAYERLITKE